MPLQILDIPSKLFYHNKVVCKAILPSSSTKSIPPVHFIGVDGEESQDKDSPSYYNEYEAMEVAKQVHKNLKLMHESVTQYSIITVILISINIFSDWKANVNWN